MLAKALNLARDWRAESGSIELVLELKGVSVLRERARPPLRC
jgi:hypothetical protein